MNTPTASCLDRCITQPRSIEKGNEQSFLWKLQSAGRQVTRARYAIDSHIGFIFDVEDERRQLCRATEIHWDAVNQLTNEFDSAVVTCVETLALLAGTPTSPETAARYSQAIGSNCRVDGVAVAPVAPPFELIAPTPKAPKTRTKKKLDPNG